jgi:dolichol-phosphate mannosyltransferase
MSADSPSTGRRRISYVFPIYNEEATIPTLYERMRAVTDPLAAEFDVEFVFVDDGSKDNSLALLLALRERDDRVSVYSFARNYGHQTAITAGVDVADGDAVIVMDADLQDPPEVSVELIRAWEAGADVVYAQRRSRQDSAFKRVTAHAFYWALARLAAIDIPRDTGDFRLMDRKVVEQLRRYREHDRFVRGLVAYVGFTQVSVAFDRDARYAGKTGYPLKKMIRLAGDGIFGFSTLPLQFISRAGAVLAFLSFVWVAYLVIAKIISPELLVEGWTFVVAGMFLLGGIQMMMLGILGNYIGRIYVETQNRPLYAFRGEWAGRSEADPRRPTAGVVEEPARAPANVSTSA